MKRSVSAMLAIGVAIVTLMPASAGNVTISNGRTTPVETATADGSSPGDVTVNGDGSVKVDIGPAITLNSDNAISNQGTIQVTNGSNAIRRSC